MCMGTRTAGLKRSPRSWKSASNSLLTERAFIKAPTDTFNRYDPEIHLLLSVSPVNVDLDGNVAEMPQSLSGISGCSLWQVYYPGCPIDNWQVDDAVIVAVQTGTYRNGTVVKGTYWGIVDEMIKKAYPNLASALNLVVPHRRVIRR